MPPLKTSSASSSSTEQQHLPDTSKNSSVKPAETTLPLATAADDPEWHERLDSAAKVQSERSLFQAIHDAAWDEVVRRAISHPCEASQWTVATVRGAPVRLRALHLACSLNPPAHVVKALVEADRDAVKFPDQTGRTLLHWAVDAVAPSFEVVDLILNVHPDSARVREQKYGCIPLHVACYKRQGNDKSEDENVRIIKRLLEVFPEGALCRDSQRGWLPLHVAAKKGASASVITELIKASPSAAAIGDEDHRLPIHFVSRYAHHWEESRLPAVLDALIESYPAGLKRRERKTGFTPLHIACSTPHPSGTLKALVSSLLKHGQAAVSIPDFDQSLPLHVAARSKAPFGVLRDLLVANPTTAADRDKHGRIALHWASQMNAPASCVETLLRVYPGGAGVAESKYGFTPLHVALHKGAEIAVVSSLLSHHPTSARVKDKHGALPIHVLCRYLNRNSPAVLKMLVHAYPESLSVKDRNGERPVDLAKMCQDQDLKAAMFAILDEYDMHTVTSESHCCNESIPSGHHSVASSRGPASFSVYSGSRASLGLSSVLGDRKSRAREEGATILSAQELATAQLEMPCFFCRDCRTDFTIRPCGHIRLCEQCAEEKISSLNHVCPIEGCYFQGAVKVLGEC